jgi:hypothetical protein
MSRFGAKFLRTATEIVAKWRSLIVTAVLVTLGLVTLVFLPTLEATGFQTEKPEVLTRVESPVVLRTRPEWFEFVLTKDLLDSRNLLSTLGARQKGHVYLVMRNFRVEVDPGVLYAVYLTPDPKKTKTTRKWLVGHINFYSAGQLTYPNDVFFSFDVTWTLRKISELRRSTDKLALFITPTGQPAPDSKVTVGQVQLVVQ